MQQSEEYQVHIDQEFFAGQVLAMKRNYSDRFYSKTIFFFFLGAFSRNIERIPRDATYIVCLSARPPMRLIPEAVGHSDMKALSIYSRSAF